MAVEAAMHYSRIRAQLEAMGKSISNNDLWIAAHTLSLGVTLVTNDTREFGRVAGLICENWTA